ncbi:hypothetical protein T439DRAFT_329267 [Meredithblackwellia eburnea MCA 4105]
MRASTTPSQASTKGAQKERMSEVQAEALTKVSHVAPHSEPPHQVCERDGSCVLKEESHEQRFEHASKTLLDLLMGDRIASFDFDDAQRKVIVLSAVTFGIFAVNSSAQIGLLGVSSSIDRSAEASTTTTFCVSHGFFGVMIGQVALNNQCHKLKLRGRKSPSRHLARLAWRYILTGIVAFDSFVIVKSCWKNGGPLAAVYSHSSVSLSAVGVLWALVVVLMSGFAMFPVDGIESLWALP